MWPESKEPNKGDGPPVLKTGLTTGCCATACCVAAAQCLLNGSDKVTSVSVTLPNRKNSQKRNTKICDDQVIDTKTVELNIYKIERRDKQVVAYTIKDAGDDPDVTHGASVWVAVELNKKTGVRFFAGEGVGTVTKEGLSLAVGEPAINPVPRKMMQEHLSHMADAFGYENGFDVTVGIENGEALALKTMNPKLGIVGGLSVLGTSGIVRPFSCSAYIASIHQGVDVALANGEQHIAASTGNLSEQALLHCYELNDTALIEMGDFVGALLKHIRSRFKQNLPVPKKLSICAGFGKLTKLADGHMDLHSRASSISFTALAEWATQLGADEPLLMKIASANTSIEVLKLCQSQNLDLARLICECAYEKVMNVVPNIVDVEVMAIDRKGQLIGRYPL